MKLMTEHDVFDIDKCIQYKVKYNGEEIRDQLSGRLMWITQHRYAYTFSSPVPNLFGTIQNFVYWEYEL